MQLVAGGGVKAALADFAVHLILELVEQGAGLAVNLELQIHEQLHIFIALIGIFLHEAGKGFAGDVFADDSPFSIHHANLVEPGHVKRGFLRARLVERLVKHIGLAVVAVKNLDNLVAVAVYGFIGTYRNHLFQLHRCRPPYCSSP